MAAPTTLLLGQVARCFVTIDLKSTGEMIDPPELVFKIKDPSDAEFGFTFGLDAALIRLDTGSYHIFIPLSLGGDWAWRWEAEDQADASRSVIAEGIFHVDRSAFAATNVIPFPAGSLGIDGGTP